MRTNLRKKWALNVDKILIWIYVILISITIGIFCGLYYSQIPLN